MTAIPDWPIDYPPRRCVAINHNGEQCPFFALPGSPYCQDSEMFRSETLGRRDVYELLVHRAYWDDLP